VAGAEAVLGTPELGRGGATPADTGNDQPEAGGPEAPAARPRLGARLRGAMRSTESGPLRPYAAAPLAVASGLLLVLALPPIDLWPLAPVAVAALTVALAGQRARRGAWLGFLHGLAFFVWLLHWAGTYVGPGPWFALAVMQACYVAALGAATPVLLRAAERWTEGTARARVAARAALVPALVGGAWVAEEALRDRWPFGGFPWGRLAMATGDSPYLALASLGGAPLVTFAVAATGGLLAVAAWPRWRTGVPWRPHAVAAAAGALALAAVGLAVPVPAAANGKPVTIAVIQGNVPRLGLDFNAQRRAVLDNHVNTTLALADRIRRGDAEQPDLVIWPENASDIDPLQDSEASALIGRATDTIGAPILVGAVLREPGTKLTNAGLVWEPGKGNVDRYAKRHPVPFGEYIPYRSLARKVTKKVDLVKRDFAPGDEAGVLRVGPATAGDVICFEVAYDSLVRDTVTGGADLLVVQTNNATFGLSGESAQQLAMVRLRAVEHRRPAVMASTTGVSAVIGPDGRVIEDSGLFTRAVLEQRIRLGTEGSLATRLGVLPEALLVVGTVGVLLAALLAAPIRRRSRTRKREAT
jgi:apolipoprotein N-acyltransferase